MAPRSRSTERITLGMTGSARIRLSVQDFCFAGAPRTPRKKQQTSPGLGQIFSTRDSGTNARDLKGLLPVARPDPTIRWLKAPHADSAAATDHEGIPTEAELALLWGMEPRAQGTTLHSAASTDGGAACGGLVKEVARFASEARPEIKIL